MVRLPGYLAGTFPAHIYIIVALVFDILLLVENFLVFESQLLASGVTEEQFVCESSFPRQTRL